MSEKEPVEKPYEPSENEIRSLDLLHEGQEAALRSDLKNALMKLKESLAVAKKDNDMEWIAYIEGTLAYLNSDLTGLKACISHAGDNAHVLSRLAQGLERRGASNYAEDYGI